MNIDQPPKARFPRFLRQPTLKATEALTSTTVLFGVPFALRPHRDILELETHGGAGRLRSTGDLQYGPQQDVQQAGHYHVYFLQHRLFLRKKNNVFRKWWLKVYINLSLLEKGKKHISKYRIKESENSRA